MLKHSIFDKLSDKKNRLKIALQVSKLGFSPIVKPEIVHADVLMLEYYRKGQLKSLNHQILFFLAKADGALIA